MSNFFYVYKLSLHILKYAPAIRNDFFFFLIKVLYKGSTLDFFYASQYVCVYIYIYILLRFRPGVLLNKNL